jgi:hypothetical protein
VYPTEEVLQMKIKANTANAKRAYIQMLLYLDLEPQLKILQIGVPATEACAREKYWIGAQDALYLLNSTHGGEGIRDNSVSVYGLCDPRDGKVFYVGIAADPEVRFKQHVNDALTINAIIDREEQYRQRWRLEERELIYSGADTEGTAKALGRTIEAVRSHDNLHISSSGFASAFVIEALQAAFNMSVAGKLRRPPSVKFYADEPTGSAQGLYPELLEFAKSVQVGAGSWQPV